MSETAPLVSLLMTVYNGDRFLCQAIDSILAQRFTSFELILVDDGSTDRTAAILEAYEDPRLVRITNERNIGQTRSLNRGLEVARGRFVARHDADDLSHPDRLRQQVARLLADPAVGLLASSYQLIDWRGRLLDTIRLPTTNAELQRRLEQGNIFCHGSVMMRRELLLEVGGYRAEFPVTQDYDLWLRLAERTELASLPAPLYQFRFDGSTVSRNRRALQLAYRRLARELAQQRRQQGLEGPIPENVMQAYPPEPARLLRSARWDAYLFYAAGQLPEAAAALQRARQVGEAESDEMGSWEEWGFARARELAQLRRDVAEGGGFIRWLFKTLALPRAAYLSRQTLARYYADQAFLAHCRGSKRPALRWVWEAIRHDRNWLHNRGLWAISLKALLPG